jgi:integrase
MGCLHHSSSLSHHSLGSSLDKQRPITWPHFCARFCALSPRLSPKTIAMTAATSCLTSRMSLVRTRHRASLKPASLQGFLAVSRKGCYGKLGHALVEVRTILRKNGGWFRSSMSVRSPRWVKTLRDAIKQEHGFGWNVRDIAGKVQLSRRYADKTRSSIVLDVPWNSECITPVLWLVEQLRTRMERQQIGLKEAYKLVRQPKATAGAPEGALDWDYVIQRFQKHKVEDTGEVKASTFSSMYLPVMGQVLELTRSRPVPRDAKTLLSRLRDRYGGAPGSRGRQLRMQYASQLLRFAVSEMGASERWASPSDLKPFVGKAGAAVGIGPATPIKDGQLLRLLEGIPDQRWADAIKLMACFGLRPVELAYLTARGDKLHIGYSKRTSRGSTSPAEIPGLDPVGLLNESCALLVRLKDRMLELPPLGSSDGDAAQSVRQYLNRRKVWQELKEEASNNGGRLSPYSFRHGFALRAHEMYGLSPRITAALMRHSLQTHVRHYGQWTDGNTIEEAVSRGRDHALLSGRLMT